MSPENQPPAAAVQSSFPREVGKATRRVPIWGWLVVSGGLLVALVVVVLAILFAVVAIRDQPSGPSAGGGGANRPFGALVQKILDPVPARITVRKALMGEGYVIQVYNDSERYLKFTVTHKRPTLKQASTFIVALDHGGFEEVGWKEGHIFYPGDLVEISHGDYRSVEYVVNPK